ncbi:TetR/AcrR family transcriptional regulator [Lentilactobacillus kisonensis]|uniref:Transcriptional regulator, TetR family n=1 Tax=Lentilactobacillus kisonensis F0435 TaxID=797516 RepID=H1LC59_9LACO|nr:TetR/AcrR family transcriptional regulator [Lentilactobacillus kisonensis]EHO54280.1 transcriptional regulator, TetR family [Lentilactobacillus kisonensis F0435]
MRAQDKEKQERILSGTSHIIMTQGIAAVSLSKIAKEAGIAPGTLYTYFDNKDAMLKALYLDRKQKVAEAITQISLAGEFEHELDHFMDLVYEYGKKHLEDFLLLREFTQTPILKTLGVTHEESYSGYEKLMTFVSLGVKNGAFLAIDYQVLMAYAYTPVIEYLLAINNGTLNSKTVPFEMIKQLSKRAILK